MILSALIILAAAEASQTASNQTARKGDSGDAHAFLADLYGRKIDGVFAGMRYGPKASAEIKRAFQIEDPHNAAVLAAQEGRFLFSPVAFGGDIDKALQSLQEAVTADPHSDDGYVCGAITWRKKGNIARERECLAGLFASTLECLRTMCKPKQGMVRMNPIASTRCRKR